MSDMFPPDEPNSIWSDKWEQGTDEYGYADDWYEEEVTLYNDLGFPISNTIEDWHDIATNTYGDELIENYGMDNLDIIRELENLGLWDADDWETWRSSYIGSD